MHKVTQYKTGKASLYAQGTIYKPATLIYRALSLLLAQFGRNCMNRHSIVYLNSGFYEQLIVIRIFWFIQVNAVTTESSLVMEVKRSLCSTRKPRQPRRSCCVSSAKTAKQPTCMPSSDANISKLVERRRRGVAFMDNRKLWKCKACTSFAF